MPFPLRTRLACALLLCAAPAAWSQETDSDVHDGNWTVTLQGSDGSKRSARLTVSDFGGFWQDLPARSGAMDKACTGRRFPITVQRSLPELMQFMVWGTSLAPHCPNLAAELKPVDERTLEGTLDNGMTIRMARVRSAAPR